ncbi:MAG: hypothetical protein O6931_01000 [Gammaproteobacteria bacterium]|nr:hypothetical protein [Gammaproteobacteria bacterium]
MTNNNGNINQFQAATSGIRDGDIVTIFGVDPDEYNGRWQVESIAMPVITARGPPYFRLANLKPGCTLAGIENSFFPLRPACHMEQLNHLYFVWFSPGLVCCFFRQCFLRISPRDACSLSRLHKAVPRPVV